MTTSKVLITGVSSGIGHELARRYLDEGRAVYGVARRRPDGLLGRPGFHFRELDLASFDDIPLALADLVGGKTALDLVVLNAGLLGRIQDLDRTSLDEIRHLMDVNVWSNKVLLEALWRHGVTTRQVVAVSSGAGVKGHRGWGAYAISKAALNMLMQVMSAEHPDVHFSALAPGLVDTAMQEYIRTLPDTPEYASVDRLKKAHGTDAMLDAKTAAERMARVIPGLTAHPSGTYLDMRQMPS
jgi:benzil reductase ((S)-benzoin forming)